MKWWKWIIFLFGFSLPLFSREWEYARSLNFPRTGLTCQAVGGRIYAIGGKNQERVLGVCEEYDPERDTWIIKRPMPTPRYGMVSAVWEGRIYVVGGDTSPCRPAPTGVIEVYDPQRDTWERLPSFLPTPRSGISGSGWGNSIFVMGGERRGESFTDTVEVYNIQEDRWLVRKSMLLPRAYFTTVAERKLYVLGGLYQGPVSLCEAFIESEDSWHMIRRLPSPRFLAGGCAYEGKVFLIGGITGRGEPTKKVRYYLPERDTWLDYPDLNRARAGLAVCTLRGKIYAIGGDSMGRPLAITEKTEPTGIEEEKSLPIKIESPSSFSNREVKIRERDEIFNCLGERIFSRELRRGVYFLRRPGERRKIIVVR
jgi:N-acetylneuraminic acid mutarotase